MRSCNKTVFWRAGTAVKDRVEVDATRRIGYVYMLWRAA